MKGYEIGDSIHGHRIVLTENAFAIIDRKDRWCGQGRD